MAVPSMFDYLNSILKTGEDLMTSPEAMAAYNPFVMNKWIAQYPDAFIFASELSRMRLDDKRMHYDYLLHSVRKKNRYVKWVKPDEEPVELRYLMVYYNIGAVEAYEYIDMMPVEEVNKIVEKVKSAGIEFKQKGRKKPAAKKKKSEILNMALVTQKPIDLVGVRNDELTQDDLVNHLVEVELPDDSNEDAFLRVRETLTRLGTTRFADVDSKTLYQSCHILHKHGRYYIVHFKMMFMLDGRYNHLTVDDIGRMNLIIDLLQQWGLIRVINPEQIESPKMPIKRLRILSHEESKSWTLRPKYMMGAK